ncbi:putative alcohol dehydrogenase [Trichoderma evansii]
MSTLYQAWQYHPVSSSHDEFDPDILRNLCLRDVQKGCPGPKQVLIRIKAAALNFRDLLLIAGSPKYPTPTATGLSIGSDGAGFVEAAGPGSRWSVRDEEGEVEAFDGTALGSGNTSGTLQQYRLFDDHWLVKKPQHLSWEQAATIPGCGGTAVNALFHTGVADGLDLTGKTVLTQGTGGTSCFVVQIAAATGARVISTTGSEEKIEFLKRIGAQDVINYKTHPQWEDEVLKLTDNRGVDLVVDVAGAESIEQSIKASRFGGTIAMVGFMTPSKQTNLIIPIIFGAKHSKSQNAPLLSALELT